jgi:uncharacterized repeat protein (TIGR01451 family)
MKKSYLTTLFLMTIFSVVLPAKIFADTSCQPIYGGGQTCITTGNISINKTVLNPETNKMVDGLSINDPRYQPGYLVTFQIAVTNTDNNNISKIKVSDVFPQYVTFSSGPGSFDNNTKSLSFEIDNLAANETKTFTILGRIVSDSQIPISQGGIVCVVNQAIAYNLDNKSQVSQDNAQLCIEKTPVPAVVVNTKGGFPVLPSAPVTYSPKTGPEMFGLIALIPTGIAGLFLRKKSI